VRGDVDYKRLYELICNRGKEVRKLEYSENHHITPQCMNGSDDPENMTRLTAKEHYLAHWLLYKIYPSNWKISNAFFWMATENKKNSRRITSTQYERAKIAMSKNCSVRMKDVGNPMHKEDAKKKISESMKGDNNPMRRFPERNHILNGGMTPSMGDAKWFTDGTSSKYFRPDEIVPNGWSEGMAPFPDRGRWITNGVDIRRLKAGQEMPEGFYYGMRKKYR
jgi:hypothetical protein